MANTEEVDKKQIVQKLSLFSLEIKQCRSSQEKPQLRSHTVVVRGSKPL